MSLYAGSGEFVLTGSFKQDGSCALSRKVDRFIFYDPLSSKVCCGSRHGKSESNAKSKKATIVINAFILAGFIAVPPLWIGHSIHPQKEGDFFTPPVALTQKAHPPTSATRARRVPRPRSPRGGRSQGAPGRSLCRT